MKTNHCLIYHPQNLCAEGILLYMKAILPNISFELIRDKTKLFNTPCNKILIMESDEISEKNVFVSQSIGSHIALISLDSFRSYRAGDQMLLFESNSLVDWIIEAMKNGAVDRKIKITTT